MKVNHQMIRTLDMLIRTVVKKQISVEDFIKQISTISKRWPIKLNPDYSYNASTLIANEAFNSILTSGRVFTQREVHQELYDYISSQQKRIQAEDAYYRNCEIQNQVALHHYVEKLLKHYARLLFIRVDFSIQKKYQAEIDIEQFQAYLKVMNNRYSNQDGYFSDLQGYAWAIEEGVDKGLHCHALLIYDGNKHKKDSFIGSQIAEYWSELTEGKGYCFVCNDSKYKQQFEEQGTSGLGMIFRSDEQKVQNALKTALYLAKPDKELQHLRVRLPRMRTFGTGRFEIKKLGTSK